MDGAAIAIATDDTFQVIAAEGENSAAQALRNASEVNFDFLPQSNSWWILSGTR